MATNDGDRPRCAGPSRIHCRLDTLRRAIVRGIAVFAAFGCALTPPLRAATTSGGQTSPSALGPGVSRLATGKAYVASFEIIADRKQGWHAAWVQTGEDKRADIYYARIGADGKFRERARVTPSSDLTWGDAVNPPDVGVLADGTIVIAWRTKAAEPDGPSEVMLSRSPAGGEGFSPPVKVSDGPPAYRDFESMAITSDGSIAVVWIDGAGASKEAARAETLDLRGALSRDGGRTFAASKLIASNVCGCCATDLASLVGGGFLATWRGVQGATRDPMEAKIAADLGAAEAAKLPVTKPWKIEGCPHTATGLSVSSASRLVWYFNGAVDPPIWEFATGRRPDLPLERSTVLGGLSGGAAEGTSDLRLAYGPDGRLEILWKRDLQGPEIHELFLGRMGGNGPSDGSKTAAVALVRSTEAIVAPAIVPAQGKLTLAAWLAGSRGRRALDYRVTSRP